MTLSGNAQAEVEFGRCVPRSRCRSTNNLQRGLRFQTLTIGECLGQNSADSRNGNIVRRSARTKKAENRISVGGVDAPQLTPRAFLGKAEWSPSSGLARGFWAVWTLVLALSMVKRELESE